MTVSKNVLMALLILSYATWGGGMIAMKYAFESFTAMQVVFARVAFAGVIYLALYRLWSRLPYQKGDWKYLVAMVLFEPCLFFLCETFAMTYTTASQGGVIAACFPLCTAVAAWLFLGEKLTKKTIVAMLLAVAGVAGASLAAESSDQASNPILGNLLMVGAILSATGYAICVRFISRRYSFLSISAIQALGGTIVFLPFVFMTPMPADITAPDGYASTWVGTGCVSDNANTYFIGHNPGVFERVMDLEIGDKITVFDDDGASRTYYVFDTLFLPNGSNYFVYEGRIAPTGETITLQTCTGDNQRVRCVMAR